MRKPNLFIIGAQRAATTSLHLTLNLHPDIFMSEIKEPQFFTSELLRKNGDLNVYQEYIEKGKYRTYDSYISLFSAVKKEKIVGESSHYMYRPGNAKVIHSFNENSKIIFCVRNPIDRLFSEYVLLRNKERLTISYDDFINAELIKASNGERSKLHKGLYCDSIIEYREMFKEIYLMDFENLKKNGALELSKIFNFLEVEDLSDKISFLVVKSVIPDQIKNLIKRLKNNYFGNFLFKLLNKYISRSKRKLLVENLSNNVKPSEIELGYTKYYPELIEFYKNDVIQLSSIMNRDLSHWISSSNYKLPQ